MKKTLNVNLNGRVFTIDEDAYRLLEDYLSNLRIYFRKEEGATEIIADFEARIEELFSEKVRLGYQVITFEHVEEVIARVGKPADFADREERDEGIKTPSVEPVKGKKKFFRNVDNKLLGGVCSGIATYFDWSVVAIRFILIISPFVLSSLKFINLHFHLVMFANNFFVMLPLAYLIAWIIVPAAKTAEQKLQMYGQPITVENIGKTVAAQSMPVTSQEPKGCLASLVDVFVTFLKVCLAGLGCLIGIPLLFALFVIIIVLIAVLFGVGGGLLGASGGLMDVLPSFLILKHPLMAAVTGVLLIGIPVVAIIYSLIASLVKSRPMSQSVKWALLISWLVSFVLFFSSGVRVDRNKWHTDKWKWTFSTNLNEIRGNNIPSQKIFDFNEPVTSLETGKYLSANLYVVQTQDEAPSIEINGDENLVEQVQYDLQNGRLVLSTYNRLRNKENLKITLRTSDLKAINIDFVGNIHFDCAFTGEEMDIRMRGVGSIHADSLYFNSLTVRSEGVGSVNIAGRSVHARLEAAGTGKINAMELYADTVYARVDGVGSIQCCPVDYLEGSVNGVGSITYKEEPKNKNVRSSGVGKIKKR